MPEPITLTTLIVAGAAAAGGEFVKEATKDVYRKFANAIGDLFGPRACRAVAKVEDPATREEGRAELERYVGGTLEPDEASQIVPFAEALVEALKQDSAASQAAQTRVGLDVEAGGNALIRDIRGAREVAAKVRAQQDVTIEGIHMDTGRDPEK